MGYAILEANALLYFGVHTFRHHLSAQDLLAEGQRFVTGLITTFAPQLFVIEETCYAKSKRSALLHAFVDEMQRWATRHGLRVMAYTPIMVKQAITGHGAATKRDVAETLVQWHPYLAKYLRTDLRTREKYWENMFDAVALGLTGSEDASAKALDTKPSRQGRA